MRKKILDSRNGYQVRSQNRKTPFLGCRTEFFFFGKKSWSWFCLAWNFPEITIMLQLFQHYSGITDKSWKNRFFHCLSYFWPSPRNNYVIIPTTWYFPVNFTLKNYTSKLNFEKKKFSIPGRGVRFDLKIDKRPFWDVGRNFFLFLEKKVDYMVFWGEIYRRLP